MSQSVVISEAGSPHVCIKSNGGFFSVFAFEIFKILNFLLILRFTRSWNVYVKKKIPKKPHKFSSLTLIQFLRMKIILFQNQREEGETMRIPVCYTV